MRELSLEIKGSIAAFAAGVLAATMLNASVASAGNAQDVTSHAKHTMTNPVVYEETPTELDPNDCELPKPYSYETAAGVVDCEAHAVTSTGGSGTVDKCEFEVDCFYRRVWSCFPPETKIQMADRSEKKISQIKSGDLVWNPVLQKPMKVGNRLRGPEQSPLLEIGYGEIRVKVTQSHPMVVSSKSLVTKGQFQRVSIRRPNNSAISAGFRIKKASAITRDDQILGADGQFHQVTFLRTVPVEPNQVVYNFELVSDSEHPAHHMIIADGIVTGDVLIQLRQDGKKAPWE